MRHEEYVLHVNIAQLKQLISDQNLQLLPDYEQRVTVLKELKFIDENDSVQLKGRVACEVDTLPSEWFVSMLISPGQLCQRASTDRTNPRKRPRRI